MNHDSDVIAKNQAWWDAHPDLRKNRPSSTAASMALSVVHWHHNVESSWRAGGKHGPNRTEEFFLRQYAWEATKVWLIETQDELEALGPVGPTTWYQKRDLECRVRNLQHALDDFEWNTKHPYGADE